MRERVLRGGPSYYPADQRVYLDLSFYHDMETQLGAPGDFAWAYVIAHEVGHHVQQQLGTSEEVARLQREDPDEANALSVRLELQADCYAGVWAHSIFAAGDLDKGDVQEAVRASAAVGDDRLQRRAGGQVNPDSFTHGSSEQRTEWFNRGRAERRAGRLRHPRPRRSSPALAKMAANRTPKAVACPMMARCRSRF